MFHSDFKSFANLLCQYITRGHISSYESTLWDTPYITHVVVRSKLNICIWWEHVLQIYDSPVYHGTIIRTGIQSKKIFGYMRYSACRWLIAENAWKKLQNLDWFMQISFHESFNHVSWLRQWNEVSASFFFLLFRTLMREK